ncbi:MAG TPA: hypothetical protein VGQ42_08225 [Candidatus Dormibacteraeota bacterium]|nr:hypothetical protein [Candidatus Dormibacteraeota bacterium]
MDPGEAAWTTQPPGAPVLPPVPPHHHVAVAERAFGERMAAHTLLTLAAGSLAGGGIFALQQAATDWSFALRAGICGGVALVLLVGAVVLRLVAGTEDVRGTLAVVGIAFAAAAMSFAYDPGSPTPHDAVVKLVMVAGVVTVLGWFAAIVVPSAVAGMLAVVGLATAAGAAVWITVDQPRPVEVFVAAQGAGIAAAVAVLRLRILRPHPTGLGWALAGAALAIAIPALPLMDRGDAISLAGGATASAGLLLLAQRHRHVPAAIGAFLGFAFLEVYLVARFVAGGNGSGAALIAVVGVGAALAILVGAATVLHARGRLPLRRWPIPVSPGELLLVAALALTLVSLVTTSTDVKLTPTPPQLVQQGSTAAAATAPGS